MKRLRYTYSVKFNEDECSGSLTLWAAVSPCLTGRHAAKRHLDLRNQGPSEHMTSAGRGVLPFRVIVGFPAHCQLTPLTAVLSHPARTTNAINAISTCCLRLKTSLYHVYSANLKWFKPGWKEKQGLKNLET